MRRSLTLITLFFAGTLFAQDEAKILEALQASPNLQAEARQNAYNKSMTDSYEIVLHADTRATEKSFREFVEAQCGVSLKSSKGVLTHPMGIVRTVSADSLRLIATVEEVMHGSKLVLMAARGEVTLTQSADATVMTELENLLEKFAKRFYRDHYQDVISNEQKSLDKINREVEKLSNSLEREKDKKQKANERINSEESKMREADNKKQTAESEIRKLEGDKKNLEREVERTQEEIEKNKTKLNEAQVQVDALTAAGTTDGRDYKKAMKTLESAQKSDTKLYKELNKLNGNLSKMNGSISKQKDKENDADAARRKSENAVQDQRNIISQADKEIEELQKDLEKAKADQATQQDILDRLNAAHQALPQD